MISALVPGNAAIVLFGVMSGRSTLTSCCGGFVAQRDDLRGEPVAAARGRSCTTSGAVHLGVGLEHELGDAVALDRRHALQPQRRKQRRIDEAFRHRPRRDDVDGALDLGIEDEVAPGDLRTAFTTASMSALTKLRVTRSSAAVAGSATDSRSEGDCASTRRAAATRTAEVAQQRSQRDANCRQLVSRERSAYENASLSAAIIGRRR